MLGRMISSWTAQYDSCAASRRGLAGNFLPSTPADFTCQVTDPAGPITWYNCSGVARVMDAETSQIIVCTATLNFAASHSSKDTTFRDLAPAFLGLLLPPIAQGPADGLHLHSRQGIPIHSPWHRGQLIWVAKLGQLPGEHTPVFLSRHRLQPK